MSTPQLMDLGLDAYRGILTDEEIAEVRRLGSYLKGMRVQNFNSTAVGGGVAEILARLIPLMRDIGMDATWDVIDGTAPFFKVTKAFHNALHGADEEITPEMLVTFMEAQRANYDKVRTDADVVAIHDPQPAGLIDVRDRGKAKWVWRCHIDLSEADPRVWGFLRPYVDRYDAAIFHLPDYAKDLTIPQNIIPPAIDPLTEKNVELGADEIRKTVESFGIDTKRPLLVQVSRFDRLKDPIGVVKAYKIVKRWHDCQLVLAGGTAADDPEGALVLAEVKEVAGDDPDIHLLDLPPDAHRTINALQRAATVIIQKSIREGFGLVVTEAMWKGKPLVAGNVGGIRRQVLHGQTGYLVNTVEGCAFRLRQLLSNPEMAKAFGEKGRQYVRDNFLLPSYVKSWLLVLASLRHEQRRGLVDLTGVSVD